MKKREKRLSAVTMLSGSAEHTLLRIVDALNGNRKREWVSHYTDGDIKKLRRLVVAWMDERTHGNKREAHKIADLHKGKRPDFRAMPVLSGTDRADLARHEASIRIGLVGSLGHEQLSMNGFDIDPIDNAIAEFIMLRLNQLSWKLAGPCSDCREWFLKKTKKKTIYCSTRCAVSAAQKGRRGDLLREKIDLAQEALDRYQSRPLRYRDVDWKTWAADAAGTTTKSITRWITKGYLRPPQEKRNAKG